MRTYRAVNLNVLWFLIALNVLIFVITLLRREAVYFLALTPAYLSQQPWTIVSAMFVHANFLHILVNMISLYFLGSFLFRAAGERSFLAVFFLGGLTGNALYVLLGPSLTPAVGASGAVYALGGALAVIVPRVPVIVFPIPVPMPLWVAILIFFVLSFLPGIAWQAHLGGLLLGLVAGLIFRRRRHTHYF
jgi:membrane associated rhomboid family serine protease